MHWHRPSSQEGKSDLLRLHHEHRKEVQPNIQTTPDFTLHLLVVNASNRCSYFLGYSDWNWSPGQAGGKGEGQEKTMETMRISVNINGRLCRCRLPSSYLSITDTSNAFLVRRRVMVNGSFISKMPPFLCKKAATFLYRNGRNVLPGVWPTTSLS